MIVCILFSSLRKDASPSEVVTQCFIYAVTIIDREERLDSHVAVVILNRPKYILTYRI